MALATCPDCAAQVSDAAPACLRCGRPLPAAAAQAWRAAAVSLVIAAVSCGVLYVLAQSMCTAMKPSSAQTEPPSVVSPKADATANDEAQDAVKALRAFWPIGREAAAAASEKFDHCHDDLKGFTNLERCISEIVSTVTAAEGKLPPAPVARLPCGKDIEAAHRQYVAAARRFQTDFLAWLRANKGKIAPAMAAKTLPDASEAFEDVWAKKPMENDDHYGDQWGASYGRVMNVECTKQLFACPLPTGNVCWINKVAGRLGLTPDEPPGDRDSLTVAATGLRIER